MNKKALRLSQTISRELAESGAEAVVLMVASRKVTLTRSQTLTSTPSEKVAVTGLNDIKDS